MQLIRTMLLLAGTIALVAFVAINWNPVEVNLWPLANGQFLHFVWPVGFIVLFSMLLGFAPMWLFHKGVRWRFKRRISVLENSVKSAGASSPKAPAVTSQLAASAAPCAEERE